MRWGYLLLLMASCECLRREKRTIGYFFRGLLARQEGPTQPKPPAQVYRVPREREELERPKVYPLPGQSSPQGATQIYAFPVKSASGQQRQVYFLPVRARAENRTKDGTRTVVIRLIGQGTAQENLKKEEESGESHQEPSTPQPPSIPQIQQVFYPPGYHPQFPPQQFYYTNQIPYQ